MTYESNGDEDKSKEGLENLHVVVSSLSGKKLTSGGAMLDYLYAVGKNSCPTHDVAPHG
jgi:hypothetical protein